MSSTDNGQLRPIYNHLVKQLNQRNVTVVGLGRTAFSRIGFLGLIDDFRVVCIKDSKDLDCMRDKFEVKTIEGDFGNPELEKLNTSALLSVPGVNQYVSEIDPPVCLFVYKSSSGIEELIRDWNVELLSTPSELRKDYENKWLFRSLAEEAGINLAKGIQIDIDDFDHSQFHKTQSSLGKKLVFQITDYTVGGGIGTFFVNSDENYQEFVDYVGRRREAGRELSRLNVTQFLEGESASIAGCVTKHGVFTGRVQRQLVDFREVVGFYGRSGVFAGHEWGDFYSDVVHQKAMALTKKWGEFIRERGYKGIFGLDLIVNRETNEVTVVECNSRYTGAFPVYSMLQQQVGEIPLDLWHLLEFYEVDYDIDYDLIQQSYSTPKYGAQLILHNLERKLVEVKGDVQAGVYSFENGQVSFERCGFHLSDLKKETEFILTDGIPHKGELVKAGNRIGRFLFSSPITTNNGTELKPQIKKLVEHVYRTYELEPVLN